MESRLGIPPNSNGGCNEQLEAAGQVPRVKCVPLMGQNLYFCRREVLEMLKVDLDLIFWGQLVFPILEPTVHLEINNTVWELRRKTLMQTMINGLRPVKARVIRDTHSFKGVSQ